MTKMWMESAADSEFRERTPAPPAVAQVRVSELRRGRSYFRSNGTVVVQDLALVEVRDSFHSPKHQSNYGCAARRRKAKTYQAEQLLDLVERYGLTVED